MSERGTFNVTCELKGGDWLALGEVCNPSGAYLSDDGRYRYRLWREAAQDGAGRALFVMLNPSTADALADDPTIRKCIGFATRWGRRQVRIANLFAYRRTDPRVLADISMEEAIGPHNDAHLRAMLEWGDSKSPAAPKQLVVVAWGSTGGAAVARMVLERRIVVRRLLRDLGLQPMCLGTAQDGNPRHPLMLAYSTPLVPWEAP